MVIQDHHRHRPGLVGRLVPQRPGAGPGEPVPREVVEAGYEWIELGPYGYLPSDPAELQDQLDAHGLHGAGRHGVRAPAPPGLLGLHLDSRSPMSPR